MDENQARNAAFEMIRKHGFEEAGKLSQAFRDANSEGTATFANHNAVCKQIACFAASRTMFRTFA